MPEDFITDKLANEVSDKGIHIGTIEPTRESKGAWSQLFYYQNKLYNIVYSDPVDAWVVFGQEIEEKDISKNTDTPEKTLELLNNTKSKGE